MRYLLTVLATGLLLITLSGCKPGQQPAALNKITLEHALAHGLPLGSGPDYFNVVFPDGRCQQLQGYPFADSQCIDAAPYPADFQLPGMADPIPVSRLMVRYIDGKLVSTQLLFDAHAAPAIAGRLQAGLGEPTRVTANKGSFGSATAPRSADCWAGNGFGLRLIPVISKTPPMAELNLFAADYPAIVHARMAGNPAFDHYVADPCWPQARP
jgi:hypothetical protein